MQTSEAFAYGVLLGSLINQNTNSTRIIELQQEVIRLYKEIEALTPKAPEFDVHWNKISGGRTSLEALESDDIELLRTLNQWIFTFGQKYLKPYLHPVTYAETLAHMSRGIAARLAELEMREIEKQPGNTHRLSPSTIPLFSDDSE